LQITLFIDFCFPSQKILWPYFGNDSAPIKIRYWNSLHRVQIASMPLNFPSFNYLMQMLAFG